MPRGEGGDHLVWRLATFGVFDVRPFYKLLSSPYTDEFPWEGIWCAKVPKRMSFFLWITTNDGILTIDNLVKRGQLLVNRCCLCYRDGESVDHLLLHCKFSDQCGSIQGPSILECLEPMWSNGFDQWASA